MQSGSLRRSRDPKSRPHRLVLSSPLKDKVDFGDVLKSFLHLWLSVTGRKAAECHLWQHISLFRVHLHVKIRSADTEHLHFHDKNCSGLVSSPCPIAPNISPQVQSRLTFPGHKARTVSLCSQSFVDAVKCTSRIGTFNFAASPIQAALVSTSALVLSTTTDFLSS